MYNVNTRGIQTPDMVISMALFTGGLLQFLAGMWEFPRGNAFGATGKLVVLKGKKALHFSIMGVLSCSVMLLFFFKKKKLELIGPVPTLLYVISQS